MTLLVAVEEESSAILMFWVRGGYLAKGRDPSIGDRDLDGQVRLVDLLMQSTVGADDGYCVRRSCLDVVTPLRQKEALPGYGVSGRRSEPGVRPSSSY